MQAYGDMQSFYQNRYDENNRMSRQPLEYLRCKEIISRYLGDTLLKIADIGGATGAFSYWLAELGYTVSLLDYTPKHIEQAKENGKSLGITLHSCDCGDAKILPYADGEFDLALVMGPLYHMQKAEDRLQALREAYRVLKPGGTVICESISRYVNIIEGFQSGLVNDAKFKEILNENLTTGTHNPGDTPFFTTAFFHTPELLKNELEQAEFIVLDLVAVEGFAYILDSAEWLNDENKKEMLLEYIRKTERIPEMLGMAAHHMIIGKKLACVLENDMRI